MISTIVLLMLTFVEPLDNGPEPLLPTDPIILDVRLGMLEERAIKWDKMASRMEGVLDQSKDIHELQQLWRIDHERRNKLDRRLGNVERDVLKPVSVRVPIPRPSVDVDAWMLRDDIHNLRFMLIAAMLSGAAVALCLLVSVLFCAPSELGKEVAQLKGEVSVLREQAKK